MSALLAALVLAVMQVALALYVRNTLIDAAGEGARYAALPNVPPTEAEQRVRSLIAGALTDDLIRDVALATVGSGDEATIEVTVTATMPVIGLFGPEGAMEVTGRAPVETLE